jgi:hypothetical protein
MGARLWRGLWADLPCELVERVLSFLPVPDLCRWRTVCKEWDALISTPRLRALCLENGSAGWGSGYIVARVLEKAQGQSIYLSGWIVLDLAEERWYRIRHGAGELVGAPGDHINGFVSADGGLICEYRSVWEHARNAREPSVIRVYNPLQRSAITTLPNIPDHFAAGHRFFKMLNLTVVQSLDHSFKVFVINQGIAARRFQGASYSDLAIMAIFDSTIGQWRSSSFPRFREFVERGCSLSGSCVMYQELLYVLFRAREGPAHCWLLTYNILDDTWNDTGVNIDTELIKFATPRLVVSDDRLFLASLSNFKTLCLAEVVLADRALVVVFRVTPEQVFLLINVDPRQVVSGHFWNPEVVQVFGFKKSIVVMMSDKKRTPIVYDLVTGLWSRLPHNPQQPLPPGCELWYGMTTNLRLPE